MLYIFTMDGFRTIDIFNFETLTMCVIFEIAVR
jgi:hypothetical protein